MSPTDENADATWLSRMRHRVAKAFPTPVPEEVLAQQREQEAAEREQAERRNEKALREDLERRVGNYIHSVRQADTHLEAAVDALLTGHPGLGAEAPAYRDRFVKLARKHIQPGERFCGFHLEEDGRAAPTLAVVFTNGVAIKKGRADFRTGPATTSESYVRGWSPDDGSLILWGRVEAGDFSVGGWGTTWSILGTIPTLYLGLRASQELRDQPVVAAPRSTAKRRKPEPGLRLIRTARDAELAAAEWMDWMGFSQVAATAPGADGGIDVVSREAVAQVKAETVPVGRPKIQQLHGVATAAGKTGVFFSLSGYTSAAKSFAESVGVALFAFDLQGKPDAVNSPAQTLLSRSVTSPRASGRSRGRSTDGTG